MIKKVISSIKSLANKIPYRIVSVTEKEEMKSFKAKTISFINERDQLLLENGALKRKFKASNRLADLVPTDLSDPSPKDTEDRKLYVAQVSSIFRDILEPKLKHMISTFHSILEDERNGRDDDQAVKGGIYMCREFLKWGDLMISEHAAFLRNEHPSQDDSEDNN